MVISRDQRQALSLQRWENATHKGTVEAATAYGKTRIAINAVNLLRRTDRTRTVVVVVPTLQLKEQWESILREASHLEHTDVVVINSLIKRRNVKCSMLILDEIHRYAAETFSKVFDVVQYSFVLGLTATLRRIDGKHALLVEKAPIVDTVTVQECRRNGWIADFREYNLGITLDTADREAYNAMRENFHAMFSKFNHDFTMMRDCSFGIKPYAVEVEGRQEVWAPKVVTLAKRLGWRGNSPVEAFRIMTDNVNRPRGQKISVWGNDQHQFSPVKLNGFAIYGMTLMRNMKEFVHKVPSKVRVALELIERFNCKTITFGELVETAEALKEILGDRCVVYHSKVTAKVVNGRKISGAQLKRDALTEIKDNPEVKVIATAKALDQGFDYPGAEMGIIVSRTSNPTQQIQRIGRVARKHTFEDGRIKKGLIINLYVKDTNDEKWLKSAQKGTKGIGIYWVDSVEEVVEAELESESVGV